MIRAGFLALALLACLCCGKYGPPVRSSGATPAATPAVSAASAPADTEECPDPNAPAPGDGHTP